MKAEIILTTNHMGQIDEKVIGTTKVTCNRTIHSL